MSRRDQYKSPMRGTFWPSEASAKFRNEYGEDEVVGKCLRAVYYRLTGVRETNPPSGKSQVIFLLGKKIEDTLVEMWKQAGIWDNNSVRFEDKDRNISGEFDCILRNPADNRKFIVEAKSTWGYQQEKNLLGYHEGRGARKVWVPGRPKDENLLQASIYCDQTRGVLDGTKLFYVMRDNCAMMEFNVTVDDNGTINVNGIPERRFNMANIYGRYALLATMLREERLPDKEFEHTYTDERVEILNQRGELSKTAYEAHTSGKELCGAWQCKYCQFMDHCLGDNV